MKTVTTALGDVKITDITMKRSSGYGQYSIEIGLEFEGNKTNIHKHSTDSQLFDEYQDVEGDKSNFLLEKIPSLIEREVYDYISSL